MQLHLFRELVATLTMPWYELPRCACEYSMNLQLDCKLCQVDVSETSEAGPRKPMTAEAASRRYHTYLDELFNNGFTFWIPSRNTSAGDYLCCKSRYIHRQKSMVQLKSTWRRSTKVKKSFFISPGPSPMNRLPHRYNCEARQIAL